MLDVCLLGTGGTVPLPSRWLTSCLLRCCGHSLLIDCGEGTQIALHKQSFSCRQIDTILLTHFHADHTAGLPGFLLTMAKSERTEPVTIIGPKGLQEILQGVMMIARYVPFEIRYIEIAGREQTFNIGEMKVTAFAVKHSVPTYGYRIEIDRRPKFDPDRARERGIPLKCWNRLQKGETVTDDMGNVYTPDMVLGEPRRGIRFVYTTDTRPTEYITEHAEEADLLIAEGMYGDPEKQENAVKNRHMTMQESAAIAARAGVRELWFTHYSPSMVEPEIYAEEIQQIFQKAVIAHDGKTAVLKFREGE